MDENLKPIVDYINQHLEQGVPEQTIREHLHKHGWNEEWTNKAFALVKSESSLAPAHEDQPQKYTVTRSIKDTVQAIRYNPLSILLSITISYILAGLSFLGVTALIGTVLFGSLLFASSSKLLTLLFGSLIIYTVWYTLVYSFVLSVSSLAIHNGRQKRKTSIGKNLANGLAATRRVAGANVLVALVCFWPMALILFLPIILLNDSIYLGYSRTLGLILPILAVAWVYVALVRFALAPYVALFENKMPVTRTLGRSKHLLQKGGQWFLVKGFLLVWLTIIIVGKLTNSSMRDLNNVQNGFDLCLLVLSILSNGALAMLYWNRKAVRD